MLNMMEPQGQNRGLQHIYLELTLQKGLKQIQHTITTSTAQCFSAFLSDTMVDYIKSS